MSRKFTALFSITSLLFTVFAYTEDEYYCRHNKVYQICRRCINFEKPCPRETFDDTCSCDHIAIVDTTTGKFKGGPDCKTEDDFGDRYCFMDEDSVCEDKKMSTFAANSKDDLWYPEQDIYYSVEACEELAGPNVTGNDRLLLGVRITADFLNNEETGEKLVIDFPVSDSEDYDYDDDQDTEPGWKKCAEQCIARNVITGSCGAWSFDNHFGKCYLHNVNACCGQHDKQETKEEFSSGYACPHCWSTRNKCPCNLEVLQQCETCIAHSFGTAVKPIHTTSAGVLEVHKTIVNPDHCACIQFYSRRKNKWACRKPMCNNGENGTGCTDTRKCRPKRSKKNQG